MAQAETGLQASESATVQCTGCGFEVTLPPDPDRRGFVLLEPVTGWEISMSDGGWLRLCPICVENERRAAQRRCENSPLCTRDAGHRGQCEARAYAQGGQIVWPEDFESGDQKSHD